MEGEEEKKLGQARFKYRHRHSKAWNGERDVDTLGIKEIKQQKGRVDNKIKRLIEQNFKDGIQNIQGGVALKKRVANLLL